MMRLAIALLIGLLFFVYALSQPDGTEAEWQSFKSSFGKLYSTSAEEARRREIFQDNLQYIRQHNRRFHRGLSSFELGMNQFGDMTVDEVVSTSMGFNNEISRAERGHDVYEYDAALGFPAAIDWRQKGVVSAVKNQGTCGASYAFAATGALESAQAIITGYMITLSEQNIVDCSHGDGNWGCNSGTADCAFKYARGVFRRHGIDKEEAYPYEGKVGRCRWQGGDAVGCRMRSYRDLPPFDERALQQALFYFGPIAVAIDAAHRSFIYYKSGVYIEPRCHRRVINLDHSLLVVGYNTSAQGQQYYIVKNSWGMQWGDAGYVWMARNMENMCGIATNGSFPVVGPG